MYCLAPALKAWISLNTAGQAERAAAIGFGVTVLQMGGIWGSNIYIPSQKRKTTSLIGGCYAEHVYIAQNADNVATYPLGFGISLALRFAGCVVLPVVYRFMVDRVNKQRDAMPKEEIMAKYTVEELAAMGDLSPLYRYER